MAVVNALGSMLPGQPWAARSRWAPLGATGAIRSGHRGACAAQAAPKRHGHHVRGHGPGRGRHLWRVTPVGRWFPDDSCLRRARQAPTAIEMIASGRRFGLQLHAQGRVAAPLQPPPAVLCWRSARWACGMGVLPPVSPTWLAARVSWCSASTIAAWPIRAAAARFAAPDRRRPVRLGVTPTTGSRRWPHAWQRAAAAVGHSLGAQLPGLLRNATGGRPALGGRGAATGATTPQLRHTCCILQRAGATGHGAVQLRFPGRRFRQDSAICRWRGSCWPRRWCMHPALLQSAPRAMRCASLQTKARFRWRRFRSPTTNR